METSLESRILLWGIKEPSPQSEEDDIDVETIEGLALRTLIDKYNLTTRWSYEGFIWGSKDENGTFNGVVGRVTVVFI